MASCLGLYIDNNLIKYAKLSKDKDNIKIESYGVKCFEKSNLQKEVHQIVEETFSEKIPISINISEETYEYFDMYALLNRKDIPKAVKTEFEAYCGENGNNPNAYETRYALVEKPEDKENLKVIHVSENKINLNKKMQMFQGYRLDGMYPISMSIANLLKMKNRENCIIVNIENSTSITTVINKTIQDVKKLDVGNADILQKIKEKESSYSKAYQIEKETTIYTSQAGDLEVGGNNYLELIMPTLYDIVGQVRKLINETSTKIDKVYLTGAASLINNIDLYFEEYLEDVKCEILKPYFIKQAPQVNIKDYIEVNSAISLALMNFKIGITGMNFKQNNLSDQLKNVLKSDINLSKKGKENKFLASLLKNDLSTPLDNTEKVLLRVTAGLLILFIVYSGFAMLINSQMNNKTREANDSISSTNSQISLANSDNETIKTKINEYTEMIENLQEINEKIAETNQVKKAIPNLLTALMSGMPEDVQITSIENTSGRKIKIVAQSTEYDQIGFFKAKIKTDNILVADTVQSTAPQKNNGVITVEIEGELP